MEKEKETAKEREREREGETNASSCLACRPCESPGTKGREMPWEWLCVTVFRGLTKHVPTIGQDVDRASQCLVRMVIDHTREGEREGERGRKE